ncbi:MAG: hypothetical protein GY849_04180 [Deltaproteobacteria bacterium]|nr:hypothetical protein [Deltaproteobacteria bacterium]
MNKQKVIVINIPFTFAETDALLCPLDQVSIETLKTIAFLRKTGARVAFINMRADNMHIWREKPAGKNGKGVVPMMVSSAHSRASLRRELKKQAGPDEILLLCNFTFSPYLFDEELINTIIAVCESVFPDALIRIGGNFIQTYPDFVRQIKAGETFFPDPAEVDACLPDFSDMIHEDYGLFQLVKGCKHGCSFCMAAREPVKKYDIHEVLGYMKAAYDRYRPGEFWNWDPNVLLYPGHVEAFLDAYGQSGIRAGLIFALGFQPNLISDALIEKITSMDIGILTIPFDSGTARSCRIIKKPYSIIAPIQKLHRINQLDRGAIKRIQSSFIIGYAHDDFHSIFRIYLSVLTLKSHPIPFPLYILPDTAEYVQNAPLLQHKNMSALHGQLWPMIEEKDLRKYMDLFNFLLIPDLTEAKKRLFLLTPDLQQCFFEELEIRDAFVQFCIDAENDHTQALEKVEEKLRDTKRNKGMKMGEQHEEILYLAVNPKEGKDSVSKTLGNFFIRCYREKNKGAHVTVVDLYKENMGFIDEDFIAHIFHEKSYDELSSEAKRHMDLADRFISQLEKADKIVLSTPMWTFSIPAILKSYLEMVSSRLLYGLKKTLTEKPVCCILTRDGTYLGNDTEPSYINVQEQLITAAFDFMGMGGNITFICAEGLIDKSRQKEIMQAAEEKIKNATRHFGSFGGELVL